MKTQTIPRLELCGALLLSKMMKYVTSSVTIFNNETALKYLWTDSQAVLHWIRNDSTKWKVLVSNRIEEIRKNSKMSEWNCVVQTKVNQADLVSRGAYPNQLNEFWFNGYIIEKEIYNRNSTRSINKISMMR